VKTFELKILMGVHYSDHESANS